MLQVSRTGTIACWKLTKAITDGNKEQDVIYPVVIILVDGIKCLAFRDTGAGSSIISSELVRRFEEKPPRTDLKQIETMLHLTSTHIGIYKFVLCNKPLLQRCHPKVFSSETNLDE